MRTGCEGLKTGLICTSPFWLVGRSLCSGWRPRHSPAATPSLLLKTWNSRVSAPLLQHSIFQLSTLWPLRWQQQICVCVCVKCGLKRWHSLVFKAAFVFHLCRKSINMIFSRVGTTVAAATRPFQRHHNSESVNIQPSWLHFPQRRAGIRKPHLIIFSTSRCLYVLYHSSVSLCVSSFPGRPLSPTPRVDQMH